MNPIPLSELRQPNMATFISKFPNFYEVEKSMIWKSLLHGMFDPMNPHGLGNRCVMMEGVNRDRILPSISVSNFVQKQNTKEFKPKGEITLDGRVLSPKRWKAEGLFNYEQIFQGFVQAFALKNDGLTPTEENIIAEMHDIFLQMIMLSVSGNLREIIYNGVRDNSATNYDHLSVSDGFNKIVKDAAIAGLHTPLAIAPSSASDVLPKIKQLVEQLGYAYRISDTCIVKVASDVYNLLTSNATGLNTGTTVIINGEKRVETANSILDIPLPFAKNIKVVEEPFLKTGAMMATVKENFVVGFDSTNHFSSMIMREHFQELYFIARGEIGMQVRAFTPENGKKPFVCNEAAVA